MKTLEALALHITPVLLVLALALATSPSRHVERPARAAYAAASGSPAAPHTPYGSSAAVRALLF